MMGALLRPGSQMSMPLLHHVYGDRATPSTGLAHASIYPYGRMSCRDGDVVIVVQNPGEWRQLCEGVLARAEHVADPRFADNPSRVANREALCEILSGFFSSMSRAEVIKRLAGNALACSSVSSVEDLARHPALSRTALEVAGGGFKGVASRVRRDIKGGAVPALGEHTGAIRAEFVEVAA